MKKYIAMLGLFMLVFGTACGPKTTAQRPADKGAEAREQDVRVDATVAELSEIVNYLEKREGGKVSDWDYFKAFCLYEGLWDEVHVLAEYRLSEKDEINRILFSYDDYLQAMGVSGRARVYEMELQQESSDAPNSTVQELCYSAGNPKFPTWHLFYGSEGDLFRVVGETADSDDYANVYCFEYDEAGNVELQYGAPEHKTDALALKPMYPLTVGGGYVQYTEDGRLVYWDYGSEECMKFTCEYDADGTRKGVQIDSRIYADANMPVWYTETIIYRRNADGKVTSLVYDRGAELLEEYEIQYGEDGLRSRVSSFSMSSSACGASEEIPHKQNKEAENVTAQQEARWYATVTDLSEIRGEVVQNDDWRLYEFGGDARYVLLETYNQFLDEPSYIMYEFENENTALGLECCTVAQRLALTETEKLGDCTCDICYLAGDDAITYYFFRDEEGYLKRIAIQEPGEVWDGLDYEQFPVHHYEFTYDEHHNLIRQDYSYESVKGAVTIPELPSYVLESFYYEYSEDGRLVSWESDSHRLEFSYDDCGSRTGVKTFDNRSVDKNKAVLDVTYERDAEGQMLGGQIRYPNSASDYNKVTNITVHYNKNHTHRIITERRSEQVWE